MTGCEACGPCGCTPEMDQELGVQLDPCECAGCWDRRRAQLDQLHGRGLAPIIRVVDAAEPDTGDAPALGGARGKP